jgi:hypothetical protein
VKKLTQENFISKCLDNNVILIRIKYNEVNKIKYILEEKLQIVDKK